MMGCGTSSSPIPSPAARRADDPHYNNASNNTTTSYDPYPQPPRLATETAYDGLRLRETIFEAYQRLDDSIVKMEALCPGPRLATIDAWTEHLLQIMPTVDDGSMTGLEGIETATDAVSGAMPVERGYAPDGSSSISTTAATAESTMDYALDVDRAAIVRLAVQLNVALDVQRARRNETHLAELSVGRMENCARKLHADIVGHTRQRAGHLLEQYGRLKAMYDEQDGILATITAGNYRTSAEESLDQRLDAARQTRDKLGAVAEQWRIAGNLLRTAAMEANRGSELWSLVPLSNSASERIRLALDTQAASQAALVAVDYAHKSLPHVEFPHITRRRIVATRHACEYVITDMADAARCSHTAAVLEAFRTGVEQTHRWLHETFQQTLRANLTEAEAAVGQAVKSLRAERTRYMRTSEVAQRLYAGDTMGMAGGGG